MANQSMKVLKPTQLVMREGLRKKLFAHLFPGDYDEHGAVLVAAIAESDRGRRLLVREVFLARDGVDYVPGVKGYRMLQPQFIYEKLHYCRERRLCYLAVHNHGGDRYAEFSGVDLESHERGYPALLDIAGGLPVGAVVFATEASAGDIWFSTTHRSPLIETRIVGSKIQRFFPRPPVLRGSTDPMYDRQVLLFGADGQHLLANSKVGVIGVGGVGSLLVQYLAHLGVGHLVVVDNKRISKSNRSRVVGARLEDALNSPSTRKIDIAERVARTANPEIMFEGIFDNFVKDTVAHKFADCDFLFLCADSMQARLVFNALVHQYLIPGIQTGAKVRVDEHTSKVLDVFSVVRWVTPESGCLWCNGLIPRDLLAMEAKGDAACKEQTYGTFQENPSVITLNAVTAGHAANDFMMSLLNLTGAGASLEYRRFEHLERRVLMDLPRRDATCTECGTGDASRRALGDLVSLPTLSK